MVAISTNYRELPCLRTRRAVFTLYRQEYLQCLMVAVGWIRTNDLLVMSQTSYQLLHPAWYLKMDLNHRSSGYEPDAFAN